MREPSGLRALLRELEGRERHTPRDDIVRLAVRLRARDACEYCLLPTTSQFHVEYVIPPVRWDAYAHGRLPAVPPLPGRQGPEHVDNFAWCCPFCNLAKQQRVTFDVGQRTHRLYDPRRDRWADHFAFARGYLIVAGIDGVGRATELALRFNATGPEAVLPIRQELLLAGRFEYAERGILDRTHLRFFTRRTLAALVTSAGLRLARMTSTPVPLYEVVPERWHGRPLAAVHALSAAAARALPRLLAYQFIAGAKHA